MRDTFVRTLITLAKNNPNIELFTGDLGFGVLKPFWEQLPDQFTYEDAVRVRREDERPVEQTKGMLNQWVHRKFIVRLADGSYRKTESKRNE